jgi:hypothetical protein
MWKWFESHFDLILTLTKFPSKESPIIFAQGSMKQVCLFEHQCSHIEFVDLLPLFLLEGQAFDRRTGGSEFEFG